MTNTYHTEAEVWRKICRTLCIWQQTVSHWH